METLVRTRITVMFEEPFWIALYERESGGKYEVCKITFGAFCCCLWRVCG